MLVKLIIIYFYSCEREKVGKEGGISLDYKFSKYLKIHPLRRLIIGLIFLIIFIALVITMNINNGYRKQNEPSTQTAYSIAQSWVEERLQLPSTANFPKNKYEAHTTKLSNNKFKIDSYVETINQSGAMVRIRFTAVVQYRGEKDWELASLKIE